MAAPLVSVVVPTYNEQRTIAEVLRRVARVEMRIEIVVVDDGSTDAFRGELIRSLRLVSDDFRFEAEVTAKVLRIPGVRLYEVPISYYGRTFAEWRDRVKAVAALVRFRFGPR